MRIFEKFVARAIAATAALSLATAALAIDISGAGATFPFPIYSKWASAYKSASGNGLNYQSIGSGGGIKQIESKTVTFGASDMPLSVQELNRYGLLQFPTVIGGVVPVVNVRVTLLPLVSVTFAYEIPCPSDVATRPETKTFAFTVLGPTTLTVIGAPDLKKPTVAETVWGGLFESNRKL